MNDWKIILPAIVAIFVAFTGFIIKFINDIILAKRKDKLDRINKQLSDFYGPLYSLRKSSNVAWAAFRKKNKPTGAYFGNPNSPTNEEDIEIWKHYMIYVFMPINDKIYDIIVNKSDLLIENEMPKCLLDLISHIVIYKAVIKNWEKGNNNEFTSTSNFPLEVDDYIFKSFEKLKKEQYKIINKSNFIF